MYVSIQFQSESRPRMDSIAPIVHVPSVQMSVNDIIHSMEKYIPHEFYKEALGEFRKLQEIEEKIAQDENLVITYALLQIFKIFCTGLIDSINISPIDHILHECTMFI